MTATDTSAPTNFAEAEAVLAATLPGYEPRIPQTIGAKAVETAIANRRHLLCQAGTGVGKSLLTLIPAILSGKRTIVSTETKALQDQTVNKDLPFLQEHLGVPFTWALLKGRSNYLCTNRTALVAELNPTLVKRIAEAAAAEGYDGTREGLGFEVPNDLWSQCCSNTEDCADLKCRSVGGCFAAEARDRASQSQIVVVNHALLATNLTMEAEFGFSMLGDFDVVIADEAHQFEASVKSNLGSEISEASISQMLSQVANLVSEHYPTNKVTQAISEASSALSGATTLLWMALGQLIPPRETKLRLKPSVLEHTASEWEAIIGAANDFATALDRLGSSGNEKVNARVRSLKRRAFNAAQRLSDIVCDTTDETVRWLESSDFKGRRRVVLCSQPLNVAPFLQMHLFNRCTFVGVSATLKTGKQDFSYIARNLGLVDYDALDVGTVFDYPSQARFIIPANIPEPVNPTLQAWQSVVPRLIIDAINASQGRALVLFTSNSAMHRAFDVVSNEVEFECRKQGDASVPELSAWFKANTNSVLFATRSFMTGFDAQGETCSLVILDKIPFASPGDPVEEAMAEYIHRRGGNPFFERSVPEAMLILQQSVGRLIRHRSDRGVFILLDPRVWTKSSYGKTVLASLPPAPVSKTLDLAAIEGFLA